MCSLSRYVVVGGFTGVAAATLSGSDLVGALVAAVAVALTAVALRRWPALAGSCARPAAHGNSVATAASRSTAPSRTEREGPRTAREVGLAMDTADSPRTRARSRVRRPG